MKTKVFALLLAIIAGTGIVLGGAPKHVKIGDLYYDLYWVGEGPDEYGDLRACVVAQSETSNNYAGLTSVTIPNMVSYNQQTWYVKRISEGAFRNCTSLTSVTMSAGVSYISGYAFDGCTNLSSIKNPEYIKDIQYHAFRNCTSLIDFEFPENHTFFTIGNGAFENVCNVVIPVGCTTRDGSMGYYPWGAKSINGYVDGFLVYITSEKTALVACSSSAAGNVTIPSSVVKIQNKAFLGCNKITNITIPNSVTSIWKDAFYGCSGLTQIEIPNSVTEIRSGAFGKCTGLTSITIPNSVTSIGDSAFIACENIVTAQIPSSVTIISNNLFKNCKNLGSFTIQDNVTSVGSYAFWGTKINSIVIPDNVTKIGDYAFASCRNLKNIRLGKKVTEMNVNAFNNSYNITDVYWDIPSFSAFSFSQTNLKSITFGNAVTRIPDCICKDQSNLSKVEFLTDNITIIGENAFSGCVNLAYIQHFPNALQKIKANAFKDAPLISITIPVYVDEIGSGAFSGCNPKIVYWNADGSSLDPSNMNFGNRLEELYFGDEVKIIHPYLFKNQTKITKLYIPTGRIKTGAFMGCSGLQSLSFGIGVTKFDGTAFKNCTNIAGALILPDALDTIPTGAFDNCAKITSVTIGKNVKKISGFQGCTGIKTVYNFSYLSLVKHTGGVDNPAYYADAVYNNMDKQGDFLFSGTSLVGYLGYGTDITLPADYKGTSYNIGGSAFLNATQLSSITLPDAIVEIGNSAFAGCTGLTNITLPNSITKVGDNSWDGCSGLTTITFGAGLQQLGKSALANCTNIQEIYCYAKSPSLAYTNTFTNVPATADLYIPGGSLPAYQTAQGWSYFSNIIETNVVHTSGVTINPTTATIGKGQETCLYATITPSNASYKTVEWTTSDNTVATVTNGVVYGKKGGTATITCTTTDGGYSATCKVTVVTEPIAATGFVFYKSAYQGSTAVVPYSKMNEGDTLKFVELATGFIDANVMPYSVSNGNIDFVNSNPYVVAAELTSHINFTNSIKLTPLHPGTAKLTISTTDGTNISKSVYVTITPDPTIKVIGVRCLSKEITLGVGEKYILDALVLPLDATNTNVSWLKAKVSGANPLSFDIKTVESNRCEITAKSVGTAYVCVETSDGKYTDTCKINIIKKILVTGLSLNQTSKTLNIGETVQLTPVFTPSDATNQKVYWSMDNDTVATLENGLVTAIRLGSETVNCTSEDGNFTASCSITVQESQQPPVTNAITVRLKASSASGWSKVNLYYWADGIDSPAWPGTTLSKEAQGWYGYTFPASVTSVNIIWNDGNNQTVDITNVTESTCYSLNSTSGKSITCSVVNCEEESVKYTVTFKDWDGTVLKTEQVEKGHSATAPANPTREGYTFTGWDKEFSNIQSDLIVTAQYVLNESIENIYVDTAEPIKVLHEGHLYILRDGKTYTIQGAEVR